MVDFSENIFASYTIVFAFASRHDEFSQHFSRYEFGNLLRRLGVAHVLFRNTGDSHYQDGIIGIGSAEAVVVYMIKRRFGFPRALCIGVSSGACGALFYGQQALRHSDEIVAISPLTCSGKEVTHEFPRGQWRYIENAPYMDIAPVFPNGPIPKTCAYISDGDGTWLDRRMAERIGVKDIRFIPGHTHAGLARYLRDVGMLEKLIIGS
jgi:hypothetical protein